MQVTIKQFKKRASGRVALSAAIAAILASGATPFALAQDEELEEITVTGSRIANTSGFEMPVPVTTVTPSELKDFEPGSSVSTQLSNLPQFFNNRTLQNAGPGGGSSIAGSPTASLNLRNLGGNRTLVLLDGRRVVPTDKQGAVNVDLFPTALMRSVDVVTGGASAAYGADAVGGVVNFILDREFEGFRANAGIGQHEGSVGRNEQFELAGGTSFMDGRLHLIASAQSQEVDEVAPNWRRLDNFDFYGHITNPAWRPGAPAGTPQRLTRPHVMSAVTSPMGVIFGTGTVLDNLRFTPDGKSVERFAFGEGACQAGAGCLRTMAGGPEFQYRENGFDRTLGPKGNGVVTRSGFLGAQYDVSDRLQVHWQGMAGRTELHREDALRFYMPLTAGWEPIIFRDNAFLPEQVRQMMIDNNVQSFNLAKVGSLASWNDVGSKERSHDVYTMWNWSVGFDYTIPGVEWNLQGSWQRGESHRNSQVYDMTRYDRMYLASDAVVDPATGEIVCRVQLFDPSPQQLADSVAGRFSDVVINPYLPAGTPGNNKPLLSPIGLDNTIRDCVPLSLMGSGNMSREAVDYIHTYKAAKGYVDQDFAEALLTGQLFEGWGAGSIDFAFGLTWRDQQFIDAGYPLELEDLGPVINVPSLGIQGIPRGTASDPSLHALATVPYRGGQMDVWEWFAEVNVPVFESEVLFGQTQRLNANLAFRKSDYERSGITDSWKVGLDFAVIDDLRLRFTKSKDTREPTFFELHDFQGNSASATDPRFGLELYNFGQVQGGNPNLAPETAEAINIGAVWQPSFAPWTDGISLSVDWYEVEIEGAVGLLGAQRIVDECELRGVQSLCAQIVRDPVSNRIVNVFNIYQNAAQERVEGIDAEVVYQTEPNFFGDQDESFDIRWLTGIIKERMTIPAGGTTGLDQSDTRGTPDLTSVITASYGIGPWGFQLQSRYIDSVRLNAAWIEGVDVDDNSIPSMTWVNAKLSYNGEFNNGSTYSVALNVQNILDRDPPIVPGFSDFGGGSQAVDAPYDVFGRRYNLNFTYSF